MTEFQRSFRESDSRANISYFRQRNSERRSFFSRPEVEIGIRSSADSVGSTADRTTIISNAQATSALSLLVTAAVIVAVGVVAANLYQMASGRKLGSTGDFVATGVIVAIIFCSILRLSSHQQAMKLSNIYDRAHQASVAWTESFALFLAIAFAFKIGDELSRGAVISHFLLGFLVVPALHMHVPIWLARLLKSNAFRFRDIILIGTRGDPLLKELMKELELGGCRSPYLVEFNASCSNADWKEERKSLLHCVSGLAHRLGPGEIYVAAARISNDRVQSVVRALTIIPRAVLIIPDLYTAVLLRHKASEIGNEVAVALQHEPLTRCGRALKRAVDIIFSAFGIVFAAPLLIAVAIAIKWNSPGPIFFGQCRNGYQGRPFRILKFRTMTVMEDGEIVVQARKNDPRVTSVGKWLRKTSLDELPQLFNVLRGEMSLIGPRPHARAHDEKYAKLIENYEIRQHVKPGITGWAQVNGLRGETQNLDLMRRRIDLDLWYAKNCSIFLDVRILARTVLEVLRPSNAY